MKNLESIEQQKFFAQVRFALSRKYPILEKIHAIPNGGKRSKLTAFNLKKEGVLSGVWDVFLPYPNKGKCGLYIEFKYGKNKLTDNQIKFRDGLDEYYQFEVAYSCDEAIEILLKYLN